MRVLTETVVSALDIKPGDLILTYGGIFRVLTTHRYANDYAHGGLVQANISEFVDTPDGAKSDCTIPRFWRTGWNIQGAASREFIRVTVAS